MPTIALAAGCAVKLVSNILLVKIPSVNIYGAPIGSVLCQLTGFLIEFGCLSNVSADKDCEKPNS